MTPKRQEELKKLLAEVNEAVKPYSEDLDVQTAVVVKQSTPRGTAVRTLAWVSGSILAATTAYAMAMNDRAILLAVLEIAKTAFLVGIGGLALGKLLTRVSPGSQRKTYEDDESSG